MKEVRSYYTITMTRIRITEEINFSEKFGKIIFIDLYSNRLDRDSSLIDSCFDECVYSLETIFLILRKNKRWKVARRWLWKTIKDTRFGKTDLFVKDFFRDGLVDYNKIDVEV